MGVNTQRGLLRLWLVFSVMWIAAIVFSAYNSSSGPSPDDIAVERNYARVEKAIANAQKAQAADDVKQLQTYQAQTEAIIDATKRRRTANMKENALTALLPPIISLIIGSGLFWAFSGFSRNQ